MSENMTRHDLDHLTRRGFVPRVEAGYTHWVRESTGQAVPLEELAVCLMASQPGGLGWVVPRLNAAARLALGQT
jgi:hypothetical protein